MTNATTKLEAAWLNDEEITMAGWAYGKATKAQLTKITKGLYDDVKNGPTEARRGRATELLMIAGRAMDRKLARKYAGR